MLQKFLVWMHPLSSQYGNILVWVNHDHMKQTYANNLQQNQEITQDLTRQVSMDRAVKGVEISQHAHVDGTKSNIRLHGHLNLWHAKFITGNMNIYSYIFHLYTTVIKIWNIWKTQWKHAYFTFWFAGNGMAPTINKYYKFNSNPMCSVMDVKCNL